MTDQNALNFDFDAPASPSLTLDPSADLAAPASAAAEQPAVPAPEEVRLSPEEQKMVEDFAEKIDLTNSQQVLQYGAASQKKIGDFSEAALAKVSTKDLGEVGEMITSLIGELKNFDAAEEEKGLFGFFKKKQNQLESLKNKYNTAEKNVENIQSMLEGHQVQLLKDIAMLDKMYQLNMAYFKELSMYILAGKKKCPCISWPARRSWPTSAPASCSRPWTRPSAAACPRTPRPPATWPTSASGLRKSSTTSS